jgi:hydroxymethylpyrimidine pyrophosphatase-like HAD family hydrolase
VNEALVTTTGLQELSPGLGFSDCRHRGRVWRPVDTVARVLRCVYLDLDGTLVGPGGSLLRGEDGSFALEGVRALQACARAEVEVVLYSGRRQSSVFESARLIGSSAYTFEVGCGLVIDGQLEWLTGATVPSAQRGSIYDQIEASGAPALLLERYQGRLEYHTPWSIGREVSHLFRGSVDLAEAAELLDGAGFEWLRLVDNGVVQARTEQMQGLPVVHAYHLIPSPASKARAVARHMQARAYAPEDCIAVGDSREDIEVTSVVGAFWLVANALDRDPALAGEVAGRPGVRVASEKYGAGVYEAVVTTLAERDSA